MKPTNYLSALFRPSALPAGERPPCDFDLISRYFYNCPAEDARNHGRPRPQRRIRAHRPHDLESRAAMPLCPHTHAPGTGGCRGFRPQHGLFLPQRGTCGQLHRIPLPAHRRGCLRAAKPDFRHTGQSPLFRLGIPAHPARRGDAARRPVLPAVAAAVHGGLRREPLYPLQ